MTGGASGGQELGDGGGPKPATRWTASMACRRLDPQQRQRLRQLGPGTWPQPLPGALGVNPGWPDNSPVHPAVETAIYPDVIRLAAQTLQAPDTRHRAGR
jgi:hypothetical protein